MKTILVIEDNQELSEMIYTSLNEIYKIRQAFSGTEALYIIKDESFDLILLDLMLPGMCGEEVIKEIRNITNCPVIVISAIDSSEKIIEMFNNKVNDFVTKPFDLNVLKARIAYQIQNYIKDDNHTSIITYNGFRLQKALNILEFKEKELVLSNKEYKIMEQLLSNPKKIFSKNDLYSLVWEDEYMYDENTINVHLSSLRKKLKQQCDADCIETVWGMGIRLK